MVVRLLFQEKLLLEKMQNRSDRASIAHTFQTNYWGQSILCITERWPLLSNIRSLRWMKNVLFVFRRFWNGEQQALMQNCSRSCLLIVLLMPLDKISTSFWNESSGEAASRNAQFFP